MALDIIDDQNDPNKKKDQQQANPAPAAPPPSAGATPAQPGSGVNTTGQGPQAGGQPQAANNNKTGSGFVNLQNIISANKQNKLGSTVSQGLQGVAGNVRQGLGSNQQLFQQEMDKNRLGTDQDIQNRQNVLNRIGSYQAPDNVNAGGSSTFDEKTGTYVNTQGQGPQALGDDLVNPDEVNAFTRYRNGLYQGPQSLRDADQLQEQALQAENLGKNISSSGGRQALLQQFVGNNANYTRGKQALDSLLLGQTGAKDLRQGRQATFGLGNEVSGAENLAEQQGASASSLAKQFGEDTKNLIGGIDKTDPNNITGKGKLGELYTNLSKDAQTRNDQAKAEFEGLQTRLKNKQLTSDDVKRIQSVIGEGEGALFGLTPEKLSQAFTQGKFNLEDVADTTKLAKINALQKLAGTNDINLDASKLGAQRENINTDDSQFASYRDKQDKYAKDLSDYEELLGESQAEQKKYDTFQNTLQSKFADLDKKQYETQEGILTKSGENAKGKDIYDTLMAAANDPNLAYNPQIKQKLMDEASKYQYQTGGDMSPVETAYRPTYAVDPDHNADALTGKTDFAQMLGLKNMSSDVNALNTIISGIKQNQNTGGGSITDLMSPEAKQAYEASHQRTYNPYDQSLHDKIFGGPEYKSSGTGQNLVQLLGGQEGINRLIASGGASALIGTPLGHQLGQGLGGAFSSIFNGVSGGIGRIFSDEKLKKNIKSGDKDVESFLDKIVPKQYDYKDSKHGSGKQLGVMAQDLEKTHEGKFAVENTPQGKMVHFGKLSAMMLASQANIHKRLKALEGKKK